MLDQLMNEIRKGGTLQPAVLAARLNISVPLVEMMLEDLERHGIITPVATGCGQTCGGCPLVGDCSVTSPQGRMWILKAP